MSKMNSIFLVLLLSGLVQSKPASDAMVFIDDNEEDSSSVENTAEYGVHFQGDIELNEEQEDVVTNKSGKVKMDSRTGMLDERYRWPMMSDGHVNVPIEISSSFDEKQKAKIVNALVAIHDKTCIRFVWRDARHTDYVHIKDGKGCSSALGMQDGRQTLTLQKNGCLTKDTIQHEMIHALGYTHMQNHAERDKYVSIKWQNIESEHTHNFDKVVAWEYSNFGTPYDFLSVMHYDAKAFSKNGRDTIVPKDAYSVFKHFMGRVKEISPGDALRLNKMYDCAGY